MSSFDTGIAIPTTVSDMCKKCGGPMTPGKAIVQGMVGIPDFPGDSYAVTVSLGGPGKLADCLKCSECGWSVTQGEEKC